MAYLEHNKQHLTHQEVACLDIKVQQLARPQEDSLHKTLRNLLLPQEVYSDNLPQVVLHPQLQARPFREEPRIPQQVRRDLVKHHLCSELATL